MDDPTWGQGHVQSNPIMIEVIVQKMDTCLTVHGQNQESKKVGFRLRFYSHGFKHAFNFSKNSHTNSPLF